MKLILVEGNIGSGKSTFVALLEKFGPKNYIYLQEPVNIWETIIDENGKNIIENFYANQQKYAFSFQMMAYISRLNSLNNIIKEHGEDVTVISERSMFTDRNVFAKMLYDDSKIEKIEYSIYNMWFNSFIDKFKDYSIIYVNTPPDICHQRVINRARKGEEIPLEYLEKCDYYHKNWILNDDKEPLNIPHDFNDSIVDSVVDFINSTNIL